MTPWDNPGDMPDSGDRRLATERYMVLVRQLMRGGVTQADAAKRLGVSQSFVSKILRGEREAGASTADRACRRLALDPRFFYDPNLREIDWVKNRSHPTFSGEGEKSTQGERSVHGVVEQLIQQERALGRMSEAHAHELRAVYFGAREPTLDMVRAIWREMLARDAGQ
jgi:transcriptional regulator with XRE-family HTH domain